MDYTQWASQYQQAHQPSLHPPHYPQFSYFPSQNPNPNSYPGSNPSDPNSSVSGVSQAQYASYTDGFVDYSQNAAYSGGIAQTTAYSGQSAVDSSGLAVQSVYYQDASWVNKESVQVYSANPVLYANANDGSIPTNGTYQAAIPNSNAYTGAHYPVWHRTNKYQKIPKKLKIVQPVQCEVCKIVCDTQEVLEKHRLGKKHKKNLEKLKQMVSGLPTTSTTPIGPSVAAPVAQSGDKPNAGRNPKKKAARHTEDLEAKRRKLVEGGAAQEAVRMCSICNVVCNSETVFNTHLAGQKHAAMAKKHAGAAYSQVSVIT